MSRPFELSRRYDGHHYLNHDGCGLDALHEARADAEAGSAALANHCLRAFDRFADRYGIDHREARILLLDTGIRIPRAVDSLSVGLLLR